MASSENKRHRQSQKRRARNQATKSRLKSLTKQVVTAAHGDDPSSAEGQLRVAMSALQRAGRKNVLHPNTSSRRIARLSSMVHRAQARDSPT